MSKERRILTAADWSKRTHDGEKLDDATVLTLGEMSEVRKGADGGVVITISTPTPDRYRDVVKVDGINLANYARNPVVLLNHDYYGMPVARATKTYIQDSRLKSEPEFPAPEVYELGALVGRMVRAGYLNAASIGFRPTKSAWDEDRRGYDFLECDLLEWSIVGVPANPECLIEARSAGLDLAPMRRWLEQSVATYAPELALLPKATIEQALRIAAGSPLSLVIEETRTVTTDTTTDTTTIVEVPTDEAATPPDLATLSATVTQLAAQVADLSKRAGAPANDARADEPEPETPAAEAKARGISREELLAATAAAVSHTLAKAKN